LCQLPVVELECGSRSEFGAWRGNGTATSLPALIVEACGRDAEGIFVADAVGEDVDVVVEGGVFRFFSRCAWGPDEATL